MAKDSSVSDTTQDTQDSSREGRETPGYPETPSPERPRTCPTAARAGGASKRRNRRESPGLRSWTPAPTPGRGGGGHLTLPPEAPVSLPLASRMGRTGQDLRPGLEAGPAGRRGTRATAETTAARVPSQRGSPAPPAPGPPDPCAGPGKTMRLKRRAAGGQRGSYSPVPLSSFGNAAARSRRVSPSSPMLCERSPGCYRCLLSSLQGAGASRRGATWEL